MFKKLIFILLSITALQSSEYAKIDEKSYSSNYKGNTSDNNSIIEENQIQIESIKKQTLLRLQYLIKALQKIESLKAEKNPEIKFSIKALNLVIAFNKTIKLIQEHKFQGAIDILNQLPTTSKYEIIQKQINLIKNNIIQMNGLGAKWLSEQFQTKLVPDITNIINQYALPYRELLLEGHKYAVSSVAFSPDGKYLASGSADEALRIWNLENGSYENLIESATYSHDEKNLAEKTDSDSDSDYDYNYYGYDYEIIVVYCVAYSPDGKFIAAGTDDDDQIIIYNLETKKIKKLKGHTNMVNSIAFSHDGKYLASGSSDKKIRIWDVENGNIKKTVALKNSVNSIAYSSDDKYLALGSEDKTIRILHLETRKINKLEGHTKFVCSVAYSPDGKYLASGSGDKTIRIWDMKTKTELKKLEGHTNVVLSVSYSPDGKYLASGSCDMTIRIWDLETCSEIKKLEGHTDTVCSVAFSPDGKSIASSSADKTIIVWGKASYA
ncbi:MAG: WD40 repeat domain-containing protein [Candidatus Babeliales bacterium]|nr:WD40 repeat domain-containing protein [Candidatus Babeliales bacterium]